LSAVSRPEHPTPPGPGLCSLLSAWGIGAGLAPTLLLLGRLGGFSRLWRGFYGRDPRGEGCDDTPVLPVGFLQGSDAILQLGDKEVRTVVRSVAGRTWLVGSRTVAQLLVEQDVDAPTFPFYRERAATNATPHGLGTDPQYFGSLGHGRTALGRRTVLSHATMLYPSEASRKPLEATLASPTRAYLAYLATEPRMHVPGSAWPYLTAPPEAPSAPVLKAYSPSNALQAGGGSYHSCYTHPPYCNNAHPL
jgi:hypothetical protein